MKAAGAGQVLLAGKGEFGGVDRQVYAGCAAVDLLASLLDHMGVA
ncbi:hypothetical protein ACFTZG_19825 [Streptomyces albidoflavus]